MIALLTVCSIKFFEDVPLYKNIQQSLIHFFNGPSGEKKALDV